jgi:hypothetical protein
MANKRPLADLEDGVYPVYVGEEQVCVLKKDAELLELLTKDPRTEEDARRARLNDEQFDRAAVLITCGAGYTLRENFRDYHAFCAQVAHA